MFLTLGFYYLRFIVSSTGSGYIEYDEYEKLMNIQLNKMDKQTAMHRKNFKKYDKDGSGFINLEELKLVLSQPGYDMAETTILEHFKKADKNSDGKISFNGKSLIFSTNLG